MHLKTTFILRSGAAVHIHHTLVLSIIILIRGWIRSTSMDVNRSEVEMWLQLALFDEADHVAADGAPEKNNF